MILSIIGIILPVLATILISIYFHNKNESNKRIEKIVNKYIQLHQSGKNKGIHALIEAGIGEIKTETEGEKVLEKIYSRISYNSLGQFNEKIRACGIQHFFLNLSWEILNANGVEKILDEKCK